MTPLATVGFLPWWPQNPYQKLLKTKLNEMGVRVIGNPPLSLVRLLLRRDGLDVVHVHWPHGLYLRKVWRYPYVVLMLFLYRVLKNNIVWTAHEFEAYESNHRKLDEWLRRKIVQWSRAVIVHGNSSKNELLQSYGYKGTVVVARHPCFVGWYEDTVSRAEARARLGLAEGAFVFLYFGYIKPYKGVEDLISAFCAIEHPSARLLIVGTPLNDALKTDIEHRASADDRVRCVFDYVPDSDVQVYFRASDVAVFPFRRTQTSGSIMLAVTFGLPVVAPQSGTVPEYLTSEAAELFAPGDPDSLRAAMCNVLVRDLSQMREAALAQSRRDDWASFADAHLRAYSHAFKMATASIAAAS